MSNRGFQRGTMAVLALAAALRIALVMKGGQFFFPDEARYSVAREAAALMAAGKIREGLALPFEGGDHPGFKFLGLIPAWIERWTGTNDLVPGLFFGGFSLGTVVLLGLIARRIRGSEAARFGVTVAAAASATLFYYARHLLPYDASMCFALASLYVALPPADGKEGKWRLPAAGIFAGCAFLIYYGYWMLVAIAAATGALYGKRSSWERARRLALAAGGGVLVVALALAINRLFGSHQLFDRARQFSGTINQGDFHGGATTWEFLWQAERGWLPMALGFGLFSVSRWWRLRGRPGESEAASAGALAFGCAVALWLSFVVTGDLLHKFAAYGRLIRQLTPFLSLSFGLGLVPLLQGRSPWKWMVAGALVLNAAMTIGGAFAFRFPKDFQNEWSAFVARKQGPEAVSEAYYRFVNVTHYIFEPEVLERTPLETVAAARHPFSYQPYLYELYSAAQRRQRRAVDLRMRVVKMAVRPEETVAGSGTGLVALEVQFPSKRGGHVEPLLSVGPYRAGEVFFAQYLSDTSVRLGCEIMGNAVLFSEPVEVVPGKNCTICCFSGSMAPAGPALRSEVWLTYEGRELIRRSMPAHAASTRQIYAGVNAIDADSAETQFSGTISRVRRGGLPPPLRAEAKGGFGAIRMKITAPSSLSGKPEPLFVVGEPGRAVLAYVVPMADGRLKFGVEIWGVGFRESGPVYSQPDGAVEVTVEFGALYPPVGDPAWGSLPIEAQEDRKGHVRVWLDGEQLLDTAADTPELGPTSATLGQNSVGGSYVGDRFSGRILSSGRIGWQGQEPVPAGR